MFPLHVLLFWVLRGLVMRAPPVSEPCPGFPSTIFGTTSTRWGNNHEHIRFFLLSISCNSSRPLLADAMHISIELALESFLSLNLTRNVWGEGTLFSGTGSECTTTLNSLTKLSSIWAHRPVSQKLIATVLPRWQDFILYIQRFSNCFFLQNKCRWNNLHIVGAGSCLNNTDLLGPYECPTDQCAVFFSQFTDGLQVAT